MALLARKRGTGLFDSIFWYDTMNHWFFVTFVPGQGPSYNLETILMNTPQCFLVFVGWLFLVSNASAHSDFYGLIGYGESRIAGKGDEIDTRTYSALGHQLVLEKSAKTDGISSVKQFGIGYTWNKYVSIEALYYRGFRASIRYEATAKLDEQSIGADATYTAVMDGFELALVPKIPLTDYLSATLRVGVFRGSERENVSSSLFPNGYTIEVRKRRATVPVLGIGLRYQLSQQVAVTAVRIGVNRKFSLTTAGVQYSF